MVNIIYAVWVVTLLGCSESAAPDAGQDTGFESDAGDDAADEDAAPEVCEDDEWEPDNAEVVAVFDAIPNGLRPAYSETWEGTWTNGTFDDVDRLWLNVSAELAHYRGVASGTQAWTVRATDAGVLQVTITCIEEGDLFARCNGMGTFNSCTRHGADEVLIVGDCGRGEAVLEVVARERPGAECARSITVEITE